MAPRVSASVTLAWNWDLGRCIEAWSRVGIPAIGLVRAGMEDYGRGRAIREIRAAGLEVANYQGVPVYELQDPSRAAQRRDRTLPYLDVAAELGADCIYVATGPRGDRSWEDAAALVVEQTQAILPELRSRNLRLALEPVHPLRQDITFLNTVADTMDVVRAVDDPLVGYVFDVWHLWWERGVEQAATDTAPHVFSVQVSDHKAHTMRTMDRAMPGQGVAPVGTLLRALERGGYDRWWDLEVISDDNQQRGYEESLRVAMAAFDEVWAASAPVT